MKRKFIPFLFLFLFFPGYHSNAQQATVKPIVTIHANNTGAPIHPYVYGMFTELLGNMFEKGLWSEMLSDRKFFYPVNSSERLIPENTRRNQNRWRPIGSDSIVMDKDHAYVGEHSPMIKPEGATAHGIKQAGIALRKGKSYTGRVVLSGDTGIKINISLVWGPNPADRQTVTIKSLTDKYAKFPFSFTAGDTTNNGRIEITGTGKGTFHVGAVSLMPADNMKGFRADLIGLLKALNSKMYRWPGGNMVAGYDWRDGIGDPDKRVPRYEYAWRTVESNDVGTDEYMALCQLLNLDPYICVNAGLGDAFSAAQWVEYANGSNNTPMGKLRSANGHPQPYNVKWWGIGNEMYGEWQLGHMSIAHYILKHNMFAAAMRKVDPSIKLVASGATPFETSTTARHHRLPLPSKLPYAYGSPEDWSGNLLARSSDNFNYLAEHVYPVAGQVFNVDSQKFVSVSQPLVDRVRKIPNRIKGMADAMDVYLQRMPELKNKHITYALDEWVGIGRGMERALCAAEGLHEIFRHSDIITMGAYTAATSTIVYNSTNATYSSVGLVFKMYRQHFGTIPLQITGNSPQLPVQGTVGVDKLAISSGSDSYPVDIMAALSENRKKLTVAIANPTESEQEIEINLNELKVQDVVKAWQIQSPLNIENEPGKEPVIKIVESQLKDFLKKVKVPSTSITLYEFVIK